MDFTNLIRLCYYAYFLLLLQILSRFQIDASSISRRVGSKRLLANCVLKCHYGYDADVEGNAICRCYDPCANVFCLGGMKCVIYSRKRCRSGLCRPSAVCKEVSQHPENEVDKNFQSDSASNIGTTTTVSMLDVCSLPLSDEIFKCRRKRRRWYYDQVKGKCIKIKGCEGDGNNFSRKKLCKIQCIKSNKNKRKDKKRPRKKGGRKRRHRGRDRQASRTPKLEEFKAGPVKSSRKFPPFNIEETLLAPGVYYTAMCPPGKPMVQCAYNPCANCRDFYVLCEINLCGKCSANFYHRKTGQRLDKCAVH